MKSVLILDDDNSQLIYLSAMLEKDFKISQSNNPISALAMFKENKFDAVIVDVHMPIINGFEFIKSINSLQNSQESALFILSSDTSSENKITALNLGVKDFLWPSMHKEEIVLRIKNQIYSKKTHTNELVKSYKNISVDLANWTVYLSDKKLDLTLIESKILSFLVSRPTEVVSREDLKEFTWPDSFVLDKTLNTHLTNLRSKIEASDLEIKSVKGEGIVLL